jgi:hypothetical protein
MEGQTHRQEPQSPFDSAVTRQSGGGPERLIGPVA